MNIELHIERLVLDGLSLRHADHDVLQTAIAHELTRLLGEGGLAPELHGGGAVRSVRAGEIHWPNDPKPQLAGASIAQAVYHGIGSGNASGNTFGGMRSAKHGGGT